MDLSQLQRLFTAPSTRVEAEQPIVDIVHPYYPLGVDIPGFEVNDRHFVTIVSIFLGGWAVIIAAVLILSLRISPKLSTFDRLTLTWFALCMHQICILSVMY